MKSSTSTNNDLGQNTSNTSLRNSFILVFSPKFLDWWLTRLEITKDELITILKNSTLSKNLVLHTRGQTGGILKLATSEGVIFYFNENTKKFYFLEGKSTEPKEQITVSSITKDNRGNTLLSLIGFPLTPEQRDRFDESLEDLKTEQNNKVEFKKIQKISPKLESKTQPKPQSKPQIKMEKRDEFTIQGLNDNYKLADVIPLETLRKLLKESEVAYYNMIDEDNDILDDDVYDYAKEEYKRRVLSDPKLENSEMARELKSEANKGMEHVPEPIGRKHKAPIWLGSMDKVNKDTGELDAWLTDYDGPFNISAKMDGASALYFYENSQYKLFSRGKNGESQDISGLLEYLELPPLGKNQLVRGELIMKKSTFDENYKKKKPGDVVGYRSARNSVAGLVNKVGSNASKSKSAASAYNEDFVRDVEFIAYELIIKDRKFQLRASEQFSQLEKMKFNVARHEILNKVDDKILSELYDEYMEDLDYNIDGLIIADDHEYERPSGKNPPYATAFKKLLESHTKLTKVIRVEWEASKDGLLKPVAIYEPIEVDDVTLQRASLYNAAWVLKNVVGPGSIVRVTRSGGVIPKIIEFIKPSDNGRPQMPNLRYKWNETHVDIELDDSVSAARGNNNNAVESDASESDNSGSRADDTAMEIAARRLVNVKRLHSFLEQIGTKGIGESYMGKMYDAGIDSIVKLVTMEPEDIEFLGPTNSKKFVDIIHKRLDHITMPILMAGSGVFGRGFGKTYADALLTKYPNLFELEPVMDDDIPEMTRLFTQVDKFGPKRAKQVATRMERFINFLLSVEDLIPINEPAAIMTNANHPLKGQYIVLTGFRDKDIDDKAASAGGKVQATVTSTTTILVTKTAGGRETAKIKAARDKGVQVMTKDEFYARYMQ